MCVTCTSLPTSLPPCSYNLEKLLVIPLIFFFFKDLVMSELLGSLPFANPMLKATLNGAVVYFTTNNSYIC